MHKGIQERDSGINEKEMRNVHIRYIYVQYIIQYIYMQLSIHTYVYVQCNNTRMSNKMKNSLREKQFKHFAN